MTMRFSLVTALALLGSLACASSSAQHASGYSSDSIGDVALSATIVKERWASLARCRASDTVGLVPSERPDSFVVARAIATGQALLLEALGPRATEAREYSFQLAGVTLNGEPAVLINGINISAFAKAFYHPWTADSSLSALWRSEPLVPCDAGRMHFVAIVDRRGQVLRPLLFNP